MLGGEKDAPVTTIGASVGRLAMALQTVWSTAVDWVAVNAKPLCDFGLMAKQVIEIAHGDARPLENSEATQKLQSVGRDCAEGVFSGQLDPGDQIAHTKRKRARQSRIAQQDVKRVERERGPAREVGNRQDVADTNS